MPSRGLLIVSVLILVALVAYGFFGIESTPQPKPESVSNDITDTDSTVEPIAASSFDKPTFDIVRVDKSGTAVIAGRSQPGSEVTVLLGNKSIGSAVAGDDGSWVVVIEKPLPTGPREISLSAAVHGGEVLKSDQVVVVDVPARRDAIPLVVLGGSDMASRILQRPEVLGDPGALSIEIVDYDDEGGLIITGRSNADARVLIYLDNEPIGDTVADGDGVWTLRPVGVAPGVYTMRIDELGLEGQVSARVEVPFERADPTILATTMLRAGGTVVVQPGQSLWRIARKVYGQGYQYTVIYQANNDQIRDPDLIYPGQVFDLPE